MQLQGHLLFFLVDSGSTHSFLDYAVAAQIKGVADMPVKMVKVANGNLVPCNQQLQPGAWSADGHKFTSDFKKFPLGSYNGILGLVWLATHSPMQVDWTEHWLSFERNGTHITLLGEDATPSFLAMIELSSLLLSKNTAQVDLPAEIQEILNTYASVFEAPTGLPPRRNMTMLFPLFQGLLLCLSGHTDFHLLSKMRWRSK